MRKVRRVILALSPDSGIPETNAAAEGSVYKWELEECKREIDKLR
jgi:hypothetical protein